MKPSGSVTVAVVGGGVAGLAAAASLIDKGFDVKLLEAADYFGGRVMQALPFPGFAPVDLGAEFIHGDRTILNDIARKQSWKVHRENLLDALVYVDGKSYPCLGAEHPEISACLNEFKKLLAANEDQFTDFLYQRLCDQGLSDVALRFLDNFDVQSRGGTFTYYGLAERRQKESSFKEWGTVNMRLEGSYSLLKDYYLEKCEKVDKKLNWQVKQVILEDDQSSSVILINQDGKPIHVDFVIITVPLSILKDGDIRFSPPLPSKKQQAIDSIKVGSALKIICRFRTRFWQQTFVVDLDGFIPQMWMYSRNHTQQGNQCPCNMAGPTQQGKQCPCTMTDPTQQGKQCPCVMTYHTQQGNQCPCNMAGPTQQGKQYPCVMTRPTQQGKQCPCIMTGPTQQGKQCPCIMADPTQQGNQCPCNMAGPTQPGNQCPCTMTDPTQQGKQCPCNMTGPTQQGKQCPCNMAGPTQQWNQCPCIMTGPTQQGKQCPCVMTCPTQQGKQCPCNMAGPTQQGNQCPCNMAGPTQQGNQCPCNMTGPTQQGKQCPFVITGSTQQGKQCPCNMAGPTQQEKQCPCVMTDHTQQGNQCHYNMADSTQQGNQCPCNMTGPTQQGNQCHYNMADSTQHDEQCHVVVGFMTADKAASNIHLSSEEVCARFLGQLDTIFGTPEEPRPASDNLVNYVYYHWSKHPYVRGGYSSPTARAHGLRHHLASSVSGRLFFAGEATNVKVSATVPSAIETGERAAEEVLQQALRSGQRRVPSKI